MFKGLLCILKVVPAGICSVTHIAHRDTGESIARLGNTREESRVEVVSILAFMATSYLVLDEIVVIKVLETTLAVPRHYCIGLVSVQRAPIRRPILATFLTARVEAEVLPSHRIIHHTGLPLDE